MRQLCSVSLPASPLPVVAFSLFVPLVARIVSTSPPLPLLQPALAWLNVHVVMSSDSLRFVQRFSDETHGDATDVVLGEVLTVPLSGAWITHDDVCEASLTISAFLSVIAPKWRSRELRRMSPASDTSTGAAMVPFKYDIDGLPAPIVAIHEYLSHRLMRDVLSSALLRSAAVSPKGTPSPDQVLRKAVVGSDRDGPSVVFSFDICDSGMCECTPS